ncbi:MAG: hypothetical protein ACYCYI_10250 [Saccharofermentanales bacterium]
MINFTKNSKRNDSILIIASIALCLYALIKILSSLIDIFSPLRFAGMSIGEIFLSLLFSLTPFIYSMLLGICGILLLHGYLVQEKNPDIQNRFLQLKKTAFLSLIIISCLSIFRTIYFVFTSVISYQILFENSTGQEMISIIIFDIIGIVFRFSIFAGSIFFGLYILSKNEGFRKPGSVLYFTGSAYSLCIIIYTFIKTTIFYIGNPDNPALYGAPTNMFYENINSFLVQIMILAASVIIVFYGMQKNRAAFSLIGVDKQEG